MTELSLETVCFFEEKNIFFAGSQTTISRLQVCLLRIWFYFSPGAKRSTREAGHPNQQSVELKILWNCTSTLYTLQNLHRESIASPFFFIVIRLHLHKF